MIGGCTTANHGTFVSSTYVETNSQTEAGLIGEVVGESSQTWFLYIFPLGDAPLTMKAILDAKSKKETTQYVADVAIDGRIYWKFGYSKQVVIVEATAYK